MINLDLSTVRFVAMGVIVLMMLAIVVRLFTDERNW